MLGLNSRYFIGIGPISDALQSASADLPALLDKIADMITDAEMQVMSKSVTAFELGGSTLIWVLAESHAVLHLWSDEGFATVDLHICDYTSSSAAKALHLKQALETYCFGGAGRWQELVVEHPASRFGLVT
jgi:S-adenosylmethionine/arginine decarboxylase-like enzyme